MRMYKIGDKILCRHDDEDIYYSAKIIDIEDVDGENEYTVHYQGWNSRYDETILHSDISDRWQEYSEDVLEKSKELRADLSHGIASLKEDCSDSNKKRDSEPHFNENSTLDSSVVNFIEGNGNNIKRRNAKRTAKSLSTFPKRRSLRNKNRQPVNYCEAQLTFIHDSDSVEEMMNRDDKSGNEIFDNSAAEEKVLVENDFEGNAIDRTSGNVENDHNNMDDQFEDVSDVGVTPDCTQPISEESSHNVSNEQDGLLLCVPRPIEMKENINLASIPVQMNIQEEVESGQFVNPNGCRGLDKQNLDDDIEFPDVIEVDFTETDIEVKYAERERGALFGSKYLYLRKSPSEDKRLSVFIDSLKAKHAMELARLKKELNKKNEFDMNRLLIVKEEIAESDPDKLLEYSQTNPLEYENTKVGQLERMCRDKETQLEEMKERIEELENNNKTSKIEETKKQLEWESQKIALKTNFEKREEELMKKFYDSECKLRKCRQLIELRNEAEKLQLEEELVKKAKEERLKKMKKIQAELSD